MRAAVLGDDGRIAVRERPDPVAGAGEALVRVSLCAIPTAAVLAQRESRAEAGKVYGSELVGTVVSTGPGNGRFAAGDRVATVVSDRAGPIDGGLAELVAVPEASLVKVDAGISDAAAAQIATAALAWNAVADSNLHLGDTVCIVGAGPLGLSVLDLVLGARPAAVYVVEILPERRQRALGAGATRALGREDGIGAFLLSTLEAGGADVTFDCAGQRGTLQFSSVISRGGGGQVMMASWYDGPDGIDPNPVIKETDFRGTLPRSDTIAQAVAAMANGGAARFEALVSRTVGLEDVDSVFSSLWTAENSDLRVLVSPGA
jgi:(R,R)-butanediol dehydrogenase/meso-butanediol dehydrogenase/diacetyl reductase